MTDRPHAYSLSRLEMAACYTLATIIIKVNDIHNLRPNKLNY